nr:leucine zipper transcription factor-like protein 1 [Aegilops tauschii subsp. strangulata]
MAVVDKAEADFKERIAQMKVWFAEAREDLKANQIQLDERQRELLQKQADFDKAQEVAKAKAAKDESNQTQRRILLDAQEEDLVTREAALAAKIRAKNEEVERLVVKWAQDLMQEHKEAVDALTLDHADKLKEAIDSAEAAEAAKVELDGKVEKLELELEELRKETLKLKKDRDMTAHTLAELQVTISDKKKLLSKANDSIADLRLKLETHEKMLSESRARELTLAKELADERLLL